MISIGKTYCIKQGITKDMIHRETGYIRNKDIAYMREGIVVMGVNEVPGSKFGVSYYCLPRTLLFPTPAPALGEKRYVEEMILFHNEMVLLFEPMYIEEDVKKAVDDAVIWLSQAGFKAPTFEIQCRNCGRSVYVGKCCDNPDIHEI